MKAKVKKAIALFGGTAVLAASVGLVGVGVSPMAAASTPAAHPAPRATVAHPDATAPAGGTGVHRDVLTDCVSGLDC